MARFTVQTQITYLASRDTVALTTLHGVSGGLDVHVYDGTRYVLADTILTSGSKEIYVKNLTLRFTPSNGMIYSIPLGG